MVLAVAHDEFMPFDFDVLKSLKQTVIYDIKGVLDVQQVDGRL